ncbi:MAG TPA: orotidine-5'-phosphate decarboxylase [Firmicutes bacterium]|nr:orotidine-5'-phosphate decarboxylase [Bacillota bacterium]
MHWEVGLVNFADRLVTAVKTKKSHVVVGLDPRWSALPPQLKSFATIHNELGPQAAALACYQFGRAIIDAVYDIAVAIKPQLAFYEQYGPWGMHALVQTVEYARQQGLLVIADAKRGDIGSTATAYAQAYLGGLATAEDPNWSLKADAVTVNAYLGSDGIQPFLQAGTAAGGGIFALVKTSNPSSGELQDQLIDGEPVYAKLAHMVNAWGKDMVGSQGYSSVGAVVGATYPEEAAKLRKLMPQAIFLVPGYGAQGGSAQDVLPAFNPDGLGAVVNSSRGVIFAYQKDSRYGAEQFADAARAAAIRMRDDINHALAAR